jgi:hypothetical protein
MGKRHDDYLDFELSINARGDGTYELEARSPTGDGRATVALDFDAADVDALVSRAHQTWRGSGGETREARRTALPLDTETSLRELGGRLFAAVMAGKIGQRYRSSYDHAVMQKQGLRVRLRIQAPEIAALPWEYLYDTDQAIFVARNNQTSVVRYVEVDQPAESLRVDFPLRVLGMVAGPADQGTLQKDQEVSRMTAALADLQRKGLVQLTWTRDGTYDALADALGEVRPHILHYIGHGGFDEGRGEGALILEREDRTSHPIPATSLGELLLGTGTVRLAVLNSCDGARSSGRNVFSSTAATVVRRGVPSVVAMQYPISDRAAIRFSSELYEGLARSQPVDRAVSAARMRLNADEPESPEWGTPVVFLQSASGRLFTTGLHEIPQPATVTASAKRARPLVPAAAAVVAAGATVAWLSMTSPSSAALRGEVRAEEATFRLDSAGGFATEPVLRSILASSFASLELPVPGEPPQRLTNTDVELQGTLRLDASANFPASTLVRLRAAGEDRYSIEWGGANLPPVGVTLDGTVSVAANGETTTHQYDIPARANLIAAVNPADSVVSELEFEAAPGDSVVLEGPWLVRTLGFKRVERQFTEGAPPATEQSTIVRGTIAFENGHDREVDTAFAPTLMNGSAIDRVILTGSHVVVLFDLIASQAPGFPSRMQLMAAPLRVAWPLTAAILGALVGVAVVQVLQKNAGSLSQRGGG